jgi:hypothetical protein
VRARLGAAVRDIVFDRDMVMAPALSPQHARELTERTAGPVVKLVEMLSGTDPEKLAIFRKEYDALTGEYFSDNAVRQGYLLTRATKG